MVRAQVFAACLRPYMLAAFFAAAIHHSVRHFSFCYCIVQGQIFQIGLVLGPPACSEAYKTQNGFQYATAQLI